MAKRKISRVMLVFPSMVFKGNQSRETALFPMGLACLAAVIEKDYEVKILDSTLESFDNRILQDNGHGLYGLSDEAYLKAFKDFKPDVVGVSCLFSSLHKQALRAATLAKQADPETITVLGGPHASALPGTLLRDPAVDFCVIGEGEKPMRELLERLAVGGPFSGIKGLAYREAGNVVLDCEVERIADLDALPFPAWHLIDLEKYFAIGKVQGLRMEEGAEKHLRLMQVSTSRGCPYSCRYCGKNAVWGNSSNT